MQLCQREYCVVCFINYEGTFPRSDCIPGGGKIQCEDEEEVQQKLNRQRENTEEQQSKTVSNAAFYTLSAISIFYT